MKQLNNTIKLTTLSLALMRMGDALNHKVYFVNYGFALFLYALEPVQEQMAVVKGLGMKFEIDRSMLEVTRGAPACSECQVEPPTFGLSKCWRCYYDAMQEEEEWMHTFIENMPYSVYQDSEHPGDRRKYRFCNHNTSTFFFVEMDDDSDHDQIASQIMNLIQ